MTCNRGAFRAVQLVTRWTFAASAALCLACNSEPSSSVSPRFNAPLAARVTGDVVVSAASPDSALQDTTLDVTITGSGFTSDMVAQWALGGVADSTQVRTNNTKFINSRTIVANITISTTATAAKWDVVVMSKSKGGIGTELFTVKVRGNVDLHSRALVVFDTDVNVAAPGASANMQPAGVVSDGRDTRGLSSSNPQYQGEFCGVVARILSLTGESGDLTFDPDMGYGPQTACGSKRTLSFYLSYQAGGPRGSATSIASFSNARTMYHLAPGQAISELGGFGGTGLTNCDRIAFQHETYPSSANIRVTRLPDVNGVRQWRVESEYPHLGMCTYSRGGKTLTNGTKYLPFAYTVTEVPRPYPSYP